MIQKDGNKKVRVMIVDDSLVSRKLYQSILSTYSDFEICGFATNGREALEKISTYHPDVVSMDIEMPLMNGLEATRFIMQENPIPILIVSSLYRKEEIQLAMQVLEAGAVGIIAKPYGPGHPSYEKDAKKYANMLRAMAEVKVVKRRNYGAFKLSEQKQIESTIRKEIHNDVQLVLIGASAGGPEAVRAILQGINKKLAVPILIVQHIDPHFAEGYCQWLSGHSCMPVKIASENELLSPGTVYLASGGKHLYVFSKNRLGSFDGLPVNGHKPSVELLFDSARTHFKEHIIAVLLSGMGNDGAMALKRLHDTGATCFVQDAASCLVFGMPGEAIKLGAASRVLHPAEIAKEIVNLIVKNNL